MLPYTIVKFQGTFWSTGATLVIGAKYTSFFQIQTFQNVVSISRKLEAQCISLISFGTSQVRLGQMTFSSFYIFYSKKFLSLF
jgi:hypothetical protein